MQRSFSRRIAQGISALRLGRRGFYARAADIQVSCDRIVGTKESMATNVRLERFLSNPPSSTIDSIKYITRF